MDEFNNKDVLVMKLLHYFITEENYNPVVLRGVQNEIWLENMNSNYKIVRIVSNYIHNNEQLSFDIFKTKKIVKSIKKKTLNLSMNVLSIFMDLGDNVSFGEEKGIDFVYLENENDISKYNFLYENFPDMDKKLKFNEKGMNLFLKITDDINKKNIEDARRVEEIFKPKTPVITYILIVLNTLVFLFGFLFGMGNSLVNAFANYGPYIIDGEYYRLLTSAFVHVNILHFVMNMYVLYIVGSQAEGFFGKAKFLIIYILSALSGSLLSMLLNQNVASIGASGAIFGLFGALLYFGYNYRVYLGNTFVRQILPVILINLLFGFMVVGIDNYAHIGGLIGGYVVSMATGFIGKGRNKDRVNGIIITILLFAFLIYMNFFYVGM